MGLDQWFWKQKRNEVAYFRKVNFLHGFMDSYVGLDSSGRYCYVDEEDIEELVSRCKQVIGLLENTNEKTSEFVKAFDDKYVIEQVMELLPPTDGFYFGNTEIDDWYLDDVREVLEAAENILETFEFGDYDLVYDTWW